MGVMRKSGQTKSPKQPRGRSGLRPAGASRPLGDIYVLTTGRALPACSAPLTALVLLVALSGSLHRAQAHRLIRTLDSADRQRPPRLLKLTGGFIMHAASAIMARMF